MTQHPPDDVSRNESRATSLRRREFRSLLSQSSDGMGASAPEDGDTGTHTEDWGMYLQGLVLCAPTGRQLWNDHMESVDSK